MFHLSDGSQKESKQLTSFGSKDFTFRTKLKQHLVPLSLDRSSEQIKRVDTLLSGHRIFKH